MVCSVKALATTAAAAAAATCLCSTETVVAHSSAVVVGKWKTYTFVSHTVDVRAVSDSVCRCTTTTIHPAETEDIAETTET